ncbi:MAG: SDR family NAD(P)-dependent oxidoreductase [Longimicrobiales bacterium]|nr:SDR family NAD(P)-dependent oxidoreductase [Longimicrobiales bacterium]
MMTPATHPVAVVTGANSGVGLHTTRVLTRDGWHLIMVCRSEARGEAARAALREEFPGAAPDLLVHDLASLDDVVALADTLAERERIDALVNNAGLYHAHLEHTPEGFEWTMGINHVAHMLLTLRLQRHLRRPGARVVNVASEAHRGGRLERAPFEEILRGRHPKYSGVQAYQDSKLANVLFTNEVARRWGADGTISLSLHPGMLSTRIWQNTRSILRGLTFLIRPFMEDPEIGGRATARCVTDTTLSDHNGAYLKKFRIVEAAPAARDDDLARRVWEVTYEAILPWLDGANTVA